MARLTPLTDEDYEVHDRTPSQDEVDATCPTCRFQGAPEDFGKPCPVCRDDQQTVGDVLREFGDDSLDEYDRWWISAMERWEREENPLYVIPRGLRAGDILHVNLGIENMGDGMPPFIPGPEDCDRAKAQWEQVVPEGVKVIVTHIGHDVEIIQVAIGHDVEIIQVAAVDGTEG